MGKSKVASRKKTSSKRQKVNKMKGRFKKTRKNYLGGSSILSADINLAYPGNNVPSVPNPFLAYTGKGGSYGENLTPNLNIPSNINAMDKTVPNTGPPSIGYNFINPQGLQGGGCGCGCENSVMNGGSCSSCSVPLMNGGSCPSCSVPLMNGGSKKKGGCGPLCLPGLMVGGKRHRLTCKCTSCKMKGGNGNNGIPYPNGRVGEAWTPAIGSWPGVSGVQGSSNYLPINDYKPDISRHMIDTGANPPFSIGGKGRTRKQRGGAFSNFLGQDLINLGRQFQFGLGGAYNALAGHSSPVNPMPWKGQLPNSSSLNTMRAESI
jgi:hypothetical protein